MHRSPRELVGKIAPNIMFVLRTTSLLKSLSQDERNSASSGEGFEGSGEMTFRSHFAVVMAVLTGVMGVIFKLPTILAFIVDEGVLGGDNGLVIVLVGDAISSNLRC